MPTPSGGDAGPAPGPPFPQGTHQKGPMMTATTAASTEEPRRAGPKRRPLGGLRQGAAGPLFVAPFMVLFLLMFLAPLGYAAYLSLYQEKLIGGNAFVGLDNYVTALKDPLLRQGVVRVATFFVIQVPLMLLLALAFALALDSGLLRLARVIRLGIFVPYAVPSVVATLMWGYLYGPDFGPFAQLSDKLGLPVPHFLSDGWMLGSLANIVTWEFVGYNMIILYAALRTVPRSCTRRRRWTAPAPGGPPGPSNSPPCAPRCSSPCCSP